ncbi:MAG: UbiD family decarboxylase [Thermodesulfobacteriota bacterium]|nr:UbiD family decarboxylase [Thermodesulfobacteriota bacterium]
MGLKDLRGFIQALEKTRDVVHIKKEVDWDVEAGAISRRVYEMSGPALLFENIKDYPENRIFAGSLGTYRRVAIAMGLPPDTSLKDIYKEYERRYDHAIKPVIVNDGSCKENVLLGEKVDLNRFPAPMVHEGDGGRYIGTWDLVVCKDPDSDWVNWGMYRFMIHNEKFIVGFPRLHSHLGMLLHQKYLPKNRAMPIALVIGAHPLYHLAASGSYPKGVTEADFAGSLTQRPVELIRCETSELLVPAQSEIVIEAEIVPNGVAPEGPFGEYPGYRTEGVRMGVLARVNAMTFRNSPILTMISLGMPPDDNSVATPIASAIAVKQYLLRKEIPVVDVYSPPEAALHTIIVSVKSGGRAIVNKILDSLTTRRADWSKVIVVDNDVDPFNLFQVVHAFSVKCHPKRGIIVREIEAGKGNPLTPAYTAEERRAMEGAIVAFDCTWPPEWPKDAIPVKSAFETIYTEEIKNKVIDHWKNYGL